ncbi:hypothetical protein BU24DRAFT_418483 [Aaosphaeria arxii CBS 175.79]|uniref:Uncharacterized protein n=1 Tax=Aaosphaeria arxii CBS 175.79 TaxID=1450172 RepID=A0A6A5Y0Y6_9PLEO|nr:uncharacterized protein BU24DRAFT_418483 [Aaosphaeria arxii CBS 175.79]KAF2018919.1 hypothetical protein BU24DRAFT_418483 [Aaosphaeria arxii CBS 175.79]
MSTLESLPPEILFNILSHLSPFNSRPLRGLHNHPLELLAQTSHRLSHITEDYARHLLLVHAKKTPRLRASGPKYRDIWFRWLLTTCQDCKRSSQRLSIFEPSMTLCKNCDKKVGKMVILQHLTETALHVLLPPTYNHQI